MCFRPLRQVDSVSAEYLVVVVDNLNGVAALGAVLVNVVLALCVLLRRPDLVLLLCLVCADLLVGLAVSAHHFAHLFGTRYPDIDGAAVSAARHLLLFAAATASLLSVSAIAVGAHWKGATSRRKQWLLVAGVWSASTLIGTTLVLVGGWGTWSSEECSSSGMAHTTELLLWVCLTHLFVVVVLVAAAASWDRAAAVVGRESEETQVLGGEGTPPPAPADQDLEFGLVAVVVCYGLCWLPYTIASLLRLTEPRGTSCCSSLLQHLFFSVGVANYAIKPFLYTWGILGRRRPRQGPTYPALSQLRPGA